MAECKYGRVILKNVRGRVLQAFALPSAPFRQMAKTESKTDTGENTQRTNISIVGRRRPWRVFARAAWS